MKYILYFTILIFVLSSFKSSNTSLDYNFALSYFKKIDVQAISISEKYGLKKSDILPVVFPECARFNKLSNAFEKSILQYYYIENGSESSDFSIGYFQMKPSFIEKLDNCIENDTIFEMYKNHFSYNSTNLKIQREKRLDRLMNENWQLEYLCAFVKLMKNRYQNETIEIQELEFIASAYNYGFYKKSEEIVKWNDKKAFPNGLSMQTQNFSYAELALYCKTKYFPYEN